MSDFEGMLNNILSSPEDMDKIARMAQSIMSGGGEDERSGIEGSSGNDNGASGSPLGGIDPGMLASIAKLMQGSGESDKTDLISAMSPYLSEKRRVKMSRALQIAKVARIAGAMFGQERSGGGGI